MKYAFKMNSQLGECWTPTLTKCGKHFKALNSASQPQNVARSSCSGHLSFSRCWNKNIFRELVVVVCFAVSMFVFSCVSVFVAVFYVLVTFVCPHTQTSPTHSARSGNRRRLSSSLSTRRQHTNSHINQRHICHSSIWLRPSFCHIGSAICKHIVICPFTPFGIAPAASPGSRSSSGSLLMGVHDVVAVAAESSRASCAAYNWEGGTIE